MKRLGNMLLAALLLAAVIGFAGCGKVYSVYGRVADELDQGISNVTITFSGGYSGTTTTDANGNWSKEGLKGTVLVTPTKESWSFTPASRQVTKAATGIDFVGVPDPPMLTRIEISPSSWSMNVGEVKEFIATGYSQYDDDFAIQPAWSLDAGIGDLEPIIGSRTNLTATSPGILSLTATVGDISASASIEIIEQPKLSEIVIFPDAVFSTWNARTFHVLGFDQWGQPLMIDPSLNPIWTVTGEVGTLSTDEGASVVFTPIKNGEGTLEVRINGLKASKTISINAPILSSIEVLLHDESDPPYLCMVGSPYYFKAFPRDQFGKLISVPIQWTLDGNIGELSEEPHSWAITFTAKTSGTGKLIASANGISGYCEITVEEPRLASIYIDPSTYTMPVGGTNYFYTLGKDQAGHPFQIPGAVTWAFLGDFDYVTGIVELTNYCNILAKSAGIGTITATLGEFFATAEVIAEEPRLASISIRPEIANLSKGAQKIFRASLMDQFGRVMPITETPTWTITGNIGSVSPSTGTEVTFTAESPGTGTIIANVGEISGSANIEVQPTPWVYRLSGVVEDNEEDASISNAEVRIYTLDGMMVGSTFTSPDGSWSLECNAQYFSKYELIIQAGSPNHYVRTISIPAEDKEGIVIRIVPDDLPDFYTFMMELAYNLNAPRPMKFDSTDFNRICIYTTNPETGDSFHPETVSYLRDILLDRIYKIGMIVGQEEYDVVIDPEEELTKAPGRIAVIPQTFEGNVVGMCEIWGKLNVQNALISIEPTAYGSPTNIGYTNILLHEFGHIIYMRHPTTTDSVMSYNSDSRFSYSALDLKGTYISYEPTFVGRRSYPGDLAIDYLENILGLEWGIENLNSYAPEYKSIPEKDIDTTTADDLPEL